LKQKECDDSRKEREGCAGMVVVSGNSNAGLAQKIADYLGVKLGDVVVRRFSDGESRIEIRENMRGKDVFVIQSLCNPANENLMDLLIIIDALKRASAEGITAVIPYYGYARQDKKVGPREPITAKLVADLLETAGATRVMTMDLHSSSIQGFFNIPVDHLSSLPTVIRHFKENGIGGSGAVVVSPDVGGVERATRMKNRIDSPLAILNKWRPEPNKSEVTELIGDVASKSCMLFDDIVDTAGTLVNGAEFLLAQKGASDVSAYCTHGALSGPAMERLRNSKLKQLIITDTIPLPQEKQDPKITVVSVADVFGEAMLRAHARESISALFVPKKID